MDDEAAPEGLRGSRRWAIGGFLLASTSLLLAWWRVSWSTNGTTLRDDVRLFRAEEPLTTAWGPWATGALVAAAIALLFVRIAARSDRHEPASWRRDLGLAAVLLVLALASCLLWPADVPSFWGGRTYRVENVTTQVTEATMPGLGWWVVVAAAACVGIGRWQAGPRPAADPVQQAPPPP